MMTLDALTGRRWSKLGALAAVLIAAACGSDFTDRSEIDRLRFLAIQASPPWIVPGETSTLTPLIVGQTEGVGLSYRWSWCPLRGPNSAAFECLVTVEQLSMGVTGTSAVQLPPDLYELGTSPTAQFPPADLPADVVAGLIEDACEFVNDLPQVSNLITVPECNGTFPISVRVDVSEGDTIISGFKSLTLVYDTSATRELNANPDISDLGLDVRFGPDPIEGPIPHETEVTLELGRPDGVSPIQQLDRLSQTYTGTRTEANEDNEPVSVTFPTREQLVFSWFSDTAAFDSARSGFLPNTVQSPDRPDGIPLDEAWERARTNEWVTPRPGDFPGGPARLFVVVRDDRGGISWTSTTVQIGSSR